MCAFVIASPRLVGTTVGQFDDDCISHYYGLEIGDEITKVNGTRVFTSQELVYEIMHDGTEPLDIEVLRNGEKILLGDVRFSSMQEGSTAFGKPDFKVYVVEKNFKNVVVHSFGYSRLAVRQVWESLYDLVSGRYGLSEMSGPVGTTEIIGEAAKEGLVYVVYLAGLISVNLGILNLLPIPALDGGRIVFLIIEAIRKKRLPNDLEAKIHYVGILVLMGLMLVITCKDIINLVK